MRLYSMVVTAAVSPISTVALHVSPASIGPAARRTGPDHSAAGRLIDRNPVCAAYPPTGPATHHRPQTAPILVDHPVTIGRIGSGPLPIGGSSLVRATARWPASAA
ncbi:hypothetical protein [Actinocatenispora comari]|uniref:hypothetical protein n=1 Tax=Actinocatenispora comari TaxID=2807577 RepID=UPI001A91E62D|nr:hypothetical protein [Actinocatenispora comari]